MTAIGLWTKNFHVVPLAELAEAHPSLRLSYEEGAAAEMLSDLYEELNRIGSLYGTSGYRLHQILPLPSNVLFFPGIIQVDYQVVFRKKDFPA